MLLDEDADIAALLGRVRTIALVGASDNPLRPSHQVMSFLLGRGYDVTPVNPLLAGQKLEGRTVVASLDDVAGPIDMVDIFRRSEFAGAVVDDAIRLGAGAVWMQLDVIDDAAARRAAAAGLDVVMNRCPKVEIARLGLWSE